MCIAILWILYDGVYNDVEHDRIFIILLEDFFFFVHKVVSLVSFSRTRKGDFLSFKFLQCLLMQISMRKLLSSQTGITHFSTIEIKRENGHQILDENLFELRVKNLEIVLNI